MLQSTGLQRVGYDWVTEQQQNELSRIGKSRETKATTEVVGSGWGAQVV